MTEHPDHLLAELVDGTVDPVSRRTLDEHLASCERCRDELRLARDARRALQDLPELAEPAGIPLAVRRRTRGVPRGSWRGAGVAAAAAAVIGVGAIVISSIDGDGTGGAGQASRAERPESQGGDGGGGGGGGSLPGLTGDAPAEDLSQRAVVIPLLRETGRTYEAGDLAAIGRRFRDRARELLGGGLAPTATAFFQKFSIEDLGPRTRQAYRCVIAEVPPEQLVVPFAIEGGAFDGRPAYVAAFLQGPTPDEAYDRVVIWVVDRRSCSLLSLATQRL